MHPTRTGRGRTDAGTLFRDIPNRSARLFGNRLLTWPTLGDPRNAGEPEEPLPFPRRQRSRRFVPERVMIADERKREAILEPLVLNMRFTGHATQPAGEPPQVDVHSETESVSVEGGDGTGYDVVSYDTHVTFTSETSFTESGRVAVGRNGDALQISTGG
jgi:hypothetical protein